MERDLRAEILAAVKVLYAQHSYSDISMAMVLNAVGISKGAFYWHFKSKEEAFEAAFQECYEKAVKVTHAFDRTGMDVLTILRVRQMHILELDREDPYVYPLISNHLIYLKEKGFVSYPYGDFKTDVDSLVIQGVAEGAFADVPQEFISHFVYLFNSQLRRYFREHPESYEDEAQRERILDTLFSALKKRA